jgi:hypothetical protein
LLAAVVADGLVRAGLVVAGLGGEGDAGGDEAVDLLGAEVGEQGVGFVGEGALDLGEGLAGGADADGDIDGGVGDAGLGGGVGFDEGGAGGGGGGAGVGVWARDVKAGAIGETARRANRSRAFIGVPRRG